MLGETTDALAQTDVNSLILLVRVAGLEPAQNFFQRILNSLGLDVLGRRIYLPRTIRSILLPKNM